MAATGPTRPCALPPRGPRHACLLRARMAARTLAFLGRLHGRALPQTRPPAPRLRRRPRRPGRRAQQAARVRAGAHGQLLPAALRRAPGAERRGRAGARGRGRRGRRRRQRPLERTALPPAARRARAALRRRQRARAAAGGAPGARRGSRANTADPVCAHPAATRAEKAREPLRKRLDSSPSAMLAAEPVKGDTGRDQGGMCSVLQPHDLRRTQHSKFSLPLSPRGRLPPPTS